MTESAWAALVASGRQAEHQAIEILRRPLDTFEARLPEVLALKRWAILAIAGAGLCTSDSPPVRRPRWLSPAPE